MWHAVRDHADHYGGSRDAALWMWLGPSGGCARIRIQGGSRLSARSGSVHGRAVLSRRIPLREHWAGGAFLSAESTTGDRRDRAEVRSAAAVFRGGNRELEERSDSADVQV